jgi:hypothetical protein
MQTQLNIRKERITIPKLPEEKIRELRRKIEPLIALEDPRGPETFGVYLGRRYQLYYRKEADPNEDVLSARKPRELITEIADNVEPFIAIRTYTSYSVADILHQIPEAYVPETKAFVTTGLISPFPHEHIVSDTSTGKLYEVSKTVLYRHRDIELNLQLDDELRAILNRLSRIRNQTREEVVKSLIQKPTI